MVFTTQTEFDIDVYRNYFSALVKWLPFHHREQFLDGCMGGGVLATRVIPNVTSTLINEFKPHEDGSRWSATLDELEKDALRGIVAAPYATGFCIGFFVEGWVRAHGFMFFREKLAAHAMALAQIIAKTEPEYLQREIFIALAADSLYGNDTGAKRRADAFIEALQLSMKKK